MKFLKQSICNGIFVMAIVHLMLAFFLLPTREEARLRSLEFKCKNFYTAEQLAVSDFKNGIYHLEFAGWDQVTDRRMRLDSILRAQYKIISLYSGCVGTTDEVNHYMITMTHQLKNFYGEDFLDRAKAGR